MIKDPESPFHHPETCGKAADVLEQVGQLMKPVLKDISIHLPVIHPILDGEMPLNGHKTAWFKSACSNLTHRREFGKFQVKGGHNSPRQRDKILAANTLIHN